MMTYTEGHYQDILTNSQGRVRWNSGWRSNLIVYQCNRLLAALMKGHQRMRGILFWAVGEGAKDWDGLCPSPHPVYTRLNKEIARQRLRASQIVYLDDAGMPKKTPKLPADHGHPGTGIPGDRTTSEHLSPVGIWSLAAPGKIYWLRRSNHGQLFARYI
jgi:hypothetical protein